MLSDLARNLRHGVRGLCRERAFTATVLATFALCLGANVVIFSVVRAVLLAPLELPRPEELVTMYNRYPHAGIERAQSSALNYFERRDGGVPAFAEVGAFHLVSYIVGNGDALRRVDGIRVTPSFCRVLGMTAARGRLFTEDEGVYGKHDVVMISDAYWRAALDRDPEVLGRTLTLDGRVVTIIGVLPPRFGFLSWAPDLWRPLPFTDFQRHPSHRKFDSYALVARLQPGATIATAQDQIDALNERQLADDPNAAWFENAGYHTVVASLREDHVASVRPALLLLQAGALVLLLIGAFNVTNLLLIRASARARDWAVHHVLGARRLHLAARIGMECLLLATTGAAFGLGLGALALRLMAILGSERLPLGRNVALDATVAIVALAVAVGLGLILVLPVIALILRGDPSRSLGVESRSSTATRSTLRWRQTLITAQVALTFALLICAGLLGRSLQRLLAVDPGFQPDHVLTASVFLATDPYLPVHSPARPAFVRRWLDALRSIPGVKSAGLGRSLPVSGTVGDLSRWEEVTAQPPEFPFWVEGHPPPDEQPDRRHYYTWVVGDYFSALGVPLREGRLIDADDLERPEHVCVVDENFARRYWPDGGAVGHRIARGTQDSSSRSMTIVGVVGSVRQTSLSDARETGIVYEANRGTDIWLTAVVRTAQAPSAVTAEMRRALHEIDPALMLEEPQTMEARIDESVQPQRASLLLAGGFAGVALLLAAVGIYGVLAFVVEQRQREIGVRLALGALPAQIRRMFLGLGMRVLLPGLAAGGIAAGWAGRSLRGLLFGVSAFDVTVFAITSLVLGTTVVIASLLPSHRAAKVSPLEALRHE